MWLTQKCLNLLRLKQKFTGYQSLVFGRPLEEQLTVSWYPEQNVINYLKSWNKNLKQDSYGNLYLINPWTPLLSAHMDTVQCESDVVWMPKIHINKKKWTISYNNSIIGWDDKCWIALAMQLYEKYWDKVSLLFSRQEEKWHLWASEFCTYHSDLLKQCKYCLVLDRRWSWDIIWVQNWYCSQEFQDEIHRCTKDFGYAPEHWMLSDANAYSKYINCVNLSVGYYNAHTRSEYIVIDELKNAFNAVCNIIENFQWEYDIYVEPVREYKSSYYSSSRDKDREFVNTRNKWRDSRDKEEKKKKEESKKDNGFSPESEYTRQFFKIRKNWKLQINSNIVLRDVTWCDEPFVILEWIYEVIDYEEYLEEEEYNGGFIYQPIEDGVDKDN